jgi:DNA-binding XRE family transcriptional regulator
MPMQGVTSSSSSLGAAGERTVPAGPNSGSSQSVAEGLTFDPQRRAGARPLRQVRAERQMSPRELAHAAGVAIGTIYATESGRTVPRFAAIRQIAKALNVNPAEITEFDWAVQVRSQPRAR